MKTVTDQDLLRVLNFARCRLEQKACEYETGADREAPAAVGLAAYYRGMEKIATRAVEELENPIPADLTVLPLKNQKTHPFHFGPADHDNS